VYACVRFKKSPLKKRATNVRLRPKARAKHRKGAAAGDGGGKMKKKKLAQRVSPELKVLESKKYRKANHSPATKPFIRNGTVCKMRRVCANTQCVLFVFLMQQINLASK